MKNLKHTLAALLLLYSIGMQANWPGNTLFPVREKSSSILLRNCTFVSQSKKTVFEKAGKLNPGYISGQTKAEESSVVKILKWDFKVKFKLSRNMNIIFSYN